MLHLSEQWGYLLSLLTFWVQRVDRAGLTNTSRVDVDIHIHIYIYIYIYIYLRSIQLGWETPPLNLKHMAESMMQSEEQYQGTARAVSGYC